MGASVELTNQWSLLTIPALSTETHSSLCGQCVTAVCGVADASARRSDMDGGIVWESALPALLPGW